MTEFYSRHIDHASAWRGPELEHDRAWEYPLDDGERAELGRALARVRARGLEVAEVTKSDFPLPGLAPRLARLAAELRDGRGFAVIRGFPVQGHSLEELEILYWGLCAHLGTGLSQNSEAGLIHYVTDGARRPRQGTRGVGSPRETKLHVDLMDVVSLLCVRQAPDDPASRLASSLTVHNELLRRRPDALARLYRGFEWDRMGEHGAGESATSGYLVPFYSQADGVVSCRYNRNWINSAARRKEAPLPAEDEAIFDLVDEIAFENRLEFPFHEGDIQFCNNYTVLHGRAAHAVVAAEARKRILLRIWFDMDDIRPFADAAVVRHGIGRHGQLGWTAAELRAGLNTRPRARRADGAIAS